MKYIELKKRKKLAYVVLQVYNYNTDPFLYVFFYIFLLLYDYSKVVIN